MQKTTSTSSEADSSVCNEYLLQSTYLMHSLKVKASDENIHLWYKHKLADDYAGASFINDCLLQRMSRVNHPLLTFANITNSLLSNAAFFSRFCSHRIQI